MRRTTVPLILLLTTSGGSHGQSPTLSELEGSWFVRQYIMDSVPFWDADRATFIPWRQYGEMKEIAMAGGAQFPDSTAYAEMWRQNDEHYRNYRIEFKTDSTYTTELAAGMSKWLPVNGRLKQPNADGKLQMVDGSDMVTTTAIMIKNGELYLSLAVPMFFGTDTPKMNRELVFRRRQP